MERPQCNLCGSDATTRHLMCRDRATGEPFGIVECSRCGLRFTSPRPTAREVAAYYVGPADVSWPADLLRRWVRRRRARWCAAGLPPGRALEVGCGDGWLLGALREAGWDVAGTEQSDHSAAHARALGLPVRIGELADCGFAARSFDLVVMWHVLEHLHDPLATLAEARRLVHPASRLIVAVPNLDSWQARVAGQHWFHWDVPRHLYHFSPETMAGLLGMAGFRAEGWSFSSLTYDLRGWWEFCARSVPCRPVLWVLAGLALPSAVILSPFLARCGVSAAMVVRAGCSSQGV